jgi:putative transposase
MNLTAVVQLLPTSQQADLLRRTLEACNAACDWLSDLAWATRTFKAFDLHRLGYYSVRERFGLSAQMAVRCIKKVADAYTLDHDTQRTFRTLGSQPYDLRILSWSLTAATVSIWTLEGRITVPFVAGESHRKLLASRHGESDLGFRDGKFYLHATCKIAEPDVRPVSSFLGVDLGIANLATDSTGEAFSGAKIDRARRRRATARKQHQRKGTKSAKRKLKKMAGRQRRFQRQTNHEISKKIVAKAKALGVGIALEDLTGIRDRTEQTACKRFRRRLGNWAFSHLRTCVEYKAKREGIPVVTVDPRNTSRTCSRCGHCAKANRTSQATFCCKHCGFSSNADVNAAKNISSLGLTCNPAPKVAALEHTIS